MFDPMDENADCTTAWAPSPTATVAMTAKTPMMIPASSGTSAFCS